MHSQENASDCFVAGLRAYSFTKRDSILDIFYWICEVLQNLIFTEDRWETASDFRINQLSHNWLSRAPIKGCSQVILSVCLENI